MRGAIKHGLVVIFLLATGGTAIADHYGAIAYDRDTAHMGYSYDWQSEQAADTDAMRRCGANCELIVKFYNTCASIAVGKDKYVSWGADIDEDRAMQQAKARCDANSTGCRVQIMVCNSPNRPLGGSPSLGDLLRQGWEERRRNCAQGEKSQCR
jgi:hypothetical protein